MSTCWFFCWAFPCKLHSRSLCLYLMTETQLTSLCARSSNWLPIGAIKCVTSRFYIWTHFMRIFKSPTFGRKLSVPVETPLLIRCWLKKKVFMATALSFFTIHASCHFHHGLLTSADVFVAMFAACVITFGNICGQRRRHLRTASSWGFLPS